MSQVIQNWLAGSKRARAPGSRRPRLRLMPYLPIGIIVVIIVAGVLAPFLTPYDPVSQDLINSRLPPFWVDGGSSAHFLGTDSFGRDVFTRLLYGARVSFSVVAFSLLIAVIVGATVGIVAGYAGGWIDSVLMRLVDMVLTVPPILVALTLAVAVGPSFRNLVLVLGLLIWPQIARLIRGEALTLRAADFTVYSKAIGVPRWAILLRHILPNVLTTLLVAVTLEVSQVILAEASLSFLGAGLPAPSASWGVMIADGRGLIASGWWIALFPGIAITVTVLAFNALSDWLRDYLDPRTRET